jgi:hypothetical protein
MFAFFVCVISSCRNRFEDEGLGCRYVVSTPGDARPKSRPGEVEGEFTRASFSVRSKKTDFPDNVDEIP